MGERQREEIVPRSELSAGSCVVVAVQVDR